MGAPRNKTDRAIFVLDWVYYILILLTLVVYFLYRHEYSLRFYFLIPVGLAVIVRVISLLLKQKKGKEND